MSTARIATVQVPDAGARSVTDGKSAVRASTRTANRTLVVGDQDGAVGGFSDMMGPGRPSTGQVVKIEPSAGLRLYEPG